MATRTIAASGLAVASSVLTVGALAAGCGGGAPSDARQEDFCSAYDLLSARVGGSVAGPSAKLAEAVMDWAAGLEEVGTPDDISDDARKGFEAIVEQANEIDAADFSIEKLEQLEAGGKDASAEARKQADAFEKYLTDTCGNPLDNLDLPEMPESS